MSSKIYFSEEKKRKPLSYYLVKAVSNTALKISPRFAVNSAKKLLLTPAGNRKRTEIPINFEQTSLNTKYGDLNFISVGTGETILLTHGWSGSCTQFIPLMEKIANSGYRAVAFDHYAHGQSDGKYANLPLFIKGLDAALAKYNPQCIISHSMGTVAALNCAKHISQFLIAPTFGFYESFEKRILGTGLAKRLFTSVLQNVEQEHQMKFKQLLPEAHIGSHQKTLHIIHDEGDRFAKFTLTEQQAKLHKHIKLKKVSNLGHGRIINSDETWQFLAQSILNAR